MHIDVDLWLLFYMKYVLKKKILNERIKSAKFNSEENC